MKISRSEFVEVRGRKLHVRIWGEVSSPKLFLLHGLADLSASFQFVVDELKRDWFIIAPDWRGFGLSEWNESTYWYPDYLADLDGIFDHYSPDAPVQVVGHSLGGNVFGLYAGIRPERIVRFALIEAYGLLPPDSASAPENYGKWLDQQKTPPGNYRDYADYDELAARLLRDNARLTPPRAAFLSQHMGQPQADGRIRMHIDPTHRRVNPIMYRAEEAKACWRRITAPSLWVHARNSFVHERWLARQEEFITRRACFPDVREVMIEDCGHNIHHDHPEQLAPLLDEFFI